MADRNNPGDAPKGTNDRFGNADPMEDIKPKLNRLPWERDLQEDDDAQVNREDGSSQEDTPAVQVPHPAGSDTGHREGPYSVGTRTYATPKTAIDSAANEKLFAMGIDEFEEDRSRFRVFFDVFFGKIWKLMSLNLQTSLFNLPALLFMLFFAIYYMQLIQADLFMNATDEGGPLAYLLIGYLPLGLIFLSIPIVAFGPAQAGMHYVLRSYSYEIPVFQWSDFREKMKENFKQGMAVTFINLFVFILALLDIYMYPRMVAQMGTLLLVANYLLIVAFAVFLMMTMYIYPMMIRYELTLKNLYRNAFLMAVGRFFPNLLLLLIVLVLTYGPFLLASLVNSTIAFFVVYAYHALLGLTLPGLIISFLLNPAMDKLMMPVTAEPEQDEQE